MQISPFNFVFFLCHDSNDTNQTCSIYCNLEYTLFISEHMIHNASLIFYLSFHHGRLVCAVLYCGEEEKKGFFIIFFFSEKLI